MGLQTDWGNQIVEITSPTTSVDMQVLHDFIEDEMATPRGMTEADIINPEGKIEDPSNPGVFSQIIVILNSPWQIQFWGGSGYTRIYGGKLVGGLADEPLKATGTANDISVLESPVDGLAVVVETGTSGLTSEESQALLDIAADQATITTAIGLIQTDIGTINGSITVIESDIATMQGDLNDIEVSITAMEADILTINTNIGTIQTDIGNLTIAQQFMADIEGGRWLIDEDANQMIFFKADNVSEVARFNLLDESGSPTSDPTRISERTRV